MAAPVVGLPGSAADLVFWLDRLTAFDGRLRAAGWVVPRSPDLRVVGVSIAFDGAAPVPLSSFGLPSPDLATHYGDHASASRFDECVLVDAGAAASGVASLHVALEGRPPVVIEKVVYQCLSVQAVHQLTCRFLAELAQRDPGAMLEVGSRHRVGASLRSQLAPGWRIVGLDILAGANVDVVGDAHELSRHFPPESFDAVVSMAVFEHLLMPWKVAVELNRVLRTGALGFVVAPHAWPVHEQPWDYWRYSAHTWKALFNAATGFEILAAHHGEPADVVAHQMHSEVNFSPPFTAYLLSAVLFRKIGPTSLDWPVSLADVVDDAYPE